MSLEPFIRLEGAETEEEQPYADLPDFKEEDSDSDLDENDYDVEKEDLILSKLNHMAKEKANSVTVSINNIRISACSLDDLRCICSRHISLSWLRITRRLNLRSRRRIYTEDSHLGWHSSRKTSLKFSTLPAGKTVPQNSLTSAKERRRIK